jgi:hypothetical protein
MSDFYKKMFAETKSMEEKVAAAIETQNEIIRRLDSLGYTLPHIPGNKAKSATTLKVIQGGLKP